LPTSLFLSCLSVCYKITGNSSYIFNRISSKFACFLITIWRIAYHYSSLNVPILKELLPLFIKKFGTHKSSYILNGNYNVSFKIWKNLKLQRCLQLGLTSPGLTIFSWDLPKFSNYQFLQYWDLTKFSEMSSGLIKLNCYKYPWHWRNMCFYVNNIL
jgi:hypothetical protein